MQDVLNVIFAELNVLALPEAQIAKAIQSPETTTVSSLRMDSLDLLSLVMSIERAFDVQLEISALPKDAVISDIAMCVEKLRRQKI